MIPYEWIFGLGALALFLGIWFGVWRYLNRDKRNDAVTDEAAHELYAHPEDYDRRREELKQKVKK